MLTEETIRKRVVAFGNGSIVYTPKTWIGKEVIITLPKLSLKEELFKILDPFLENIKGIYIYGSYARNENQEDSDIDVLVICDKKFRIRKGKYDINGVSLEDVKNSIKHNPLYSLIIKEAVVVLNKSLLDELKKIKYDKRNFKWLFETTKSTLKINEKLIELEEEDFKNNACIFSLILRLRTIYMIECVIKNEVYSNKKFKEYSVKKGINNFNKLYQIYRSVRDDRKIKEKISKKDVEKLYNIIKNETEKKSKEIS